MPAQPALHAVRQLDAPRQAWLAAYRQVRAHTQQLAACLSAEDQALQASADASPTKWHLAHTTWFFEALVLMPHAAGYRPVDERWMPLFNSYYESLGPRHPRPQRGLISRPSLAEVMGYRQQVDEALQVFIAAANSVTWQAAAGALRLGLHHEQQHQELLLTDIRLALLQNPLLPAYSPLPTSAALPTQAPLPAGRLASAAPAPLRWLAWGDGPVAVGHDPETDGGFAFDNEQARHTVWLAPFALASRPVSNAEYAEFIADGGYRQPSLWLSDGWALVQAEGWRDSGSPPGCAVKGPPRPSR